MSFRPFILAKVYQLGAHWIVGLGFAVSFQEILVDRELGDNDWHMCFNGFSLAVVSLSRLQKCSWKGIGGVEEFA